jgi:broad specificity phosphatase PhoE
MAGSWRGVTPELAEWREACIASVGGLTADTVIFSHFVAINVVAGGALGDDRVVTFSPDNCSVTTFETDGVILRLVEKGGEAPLTKVN